MLTKMKGIGTCQRSIIDDGMHTELETTACVKELFAFIRIERNFQFSDTVNMIVVSFSVLEVFLSFIMYIIECEVPAIY